MASLQLRSFADNAVNYHYYNFLCEANFFMPRNFSHARVTDNGIAGVPKRESCANKRMYRNCIAEDQRDDIKFN